MFRREQEPIASAESPTSEPNKPNRIRGELRKLGQIGIVLTVATAASAALIKYGPWTGRDDPCRVPPTDFGPSVYLKNHVSSPDGSRKNVSLDAGEDSFGNAKRAVVKANFYVRRY